MKRYLTAVAVSIAVAAATTSPASATLVKSEGRTKPTAAERQLAWTEQHVKELERARVRLHRLIDQLRKQIPPPAPSEAPTPQQASATSTTPATPSYSGGVLSASQVASYARGAGFPESAISQMVYYASRESGFDPGAINSSSGACGLWQIYPAQPGCTNPATNAKLAYEKYSAPVQGGGIAGFSPWGG